MDSLLLNKDLEDYLLMQKVFIFIFSFLASLAIISETLGLLPNFAMIHFSSLKSGVRMPSSAVENHVVAFSTKIRAK